MVNMRCVSCWKDIYFELVINYRVEFGALATETQALNLGQVSCNFVKSVLDVATGNSQIKSHIL